MEIKIDLSNSGIKDSDFEKRRKEAFESLELLHSGNLDFTGWVNQPLNISQEEIDKLKGIANTIQGNSKYFLVLGVGGSFMGAKAVLDLLQPKNPATKVLFAGYNFSGRYLQSVIDTIGEDDFSVCVISKSGTTTETLSTYGIIRELMNSKYGRKETAKRTFVVTEHRDNYLFNLAQEEGFATMDLAVDIGGRYSVLTPVGLLPLAVAGIDIENLIKGAASLADISAFYGNRLDYAIARQEFVKKRKAIEVFEFYDPYFEYFAEWLKQLFGESEGKDGKGLFPASLMFSRDLHSIGQFLQQGTPSFFETMITVDNSKVDMKIPDSAMSPFGGKTILQINKCAERGVLDAHVKAKIPVISISVSELDEKVIGQLIYFFQIQCGVSALLSGVDPFNQPGVEDYKREMRGHISQL